MKLLLDTHVWIWAYEGDSSLGQVARKLLEDESSERFVSPISTMEIARLLAKESMVLHEPLSAWLSQSMAALKLRTLAVDHETALEAYALPGSFHPDPADRQLVAAARLQGCRMITADPRILAYPHVRVLDARK